MLRIHLRSVLVPCFSVYSVGRFFFAPIVGRFFFAPIVGRFFFAPIVGRFLLAPIVGRFLLAPIVGRHFSCHSCLSPFAGSRLR